VKIDLRDFDVASASEAGSQLTVQHPTKNTLTDIKIHLAGPDSKRMRDADRDITDQITKDAAEKKLTSDDSMFERLAATRAAGITLDWEGVEWDGVAFPFSRENAIKLYTEHRWIRTQVENFVGRRDNFFIV
jgi:hypothetical protein